MAEKLTIDAMWDDSPIDVSTEVNFIWSIANKLRGTYQSDNTRMSSSRWSLSGASSVRWPRPRKR